MSERESYEAGVPCWVDTLQPDPDAAMAFYADLFAWEFAGPGPTAGDSSAAYHVARKGDRDVAGVGPWPEGEATAPRAWTTYIRVESVDAALERARALGGELVAGPLDAAPAGRLAVLADPTGAGFAVWAAGDREGAQLINEPHAWSMSMLHTPNPAAAIDFYGELFGWRAEEFGVGESQAWLLRLPGFVGGEPAQPVPRDVVAVMAPLAGEGPAGAEPRWSVDFWVDDVDATADRAAKLGGDVVVPPFDQEISRQATLADPHGARFTVSRVSPPRGR
jgi:predicted enzyme related to lactoylglutathione lyase